jgi:hypothetical protein
MSQCPVRDGMMIQFAQLLRIGPVPPRQPLGGAVGHLQLDHRCIIASSYPAPSSEIAPATLVMLVFAPFL